MPGCRFATLKRPVSSVVAVSSLFVPTFLTVTAAPGTTSLLGLLTTPPIEPVVVDCAKAIVLSASTNRHTKQPFTIFAILGNSLENELLNVVATRPAKKFAKLVPDKAFELCASESDFMPILNLQRESSVHSTRTKNLDLI